MDELSDEEPGPSSPKYRKKIQGAATYKSKFNPAWIKEFPFIGPVRGDIYRYVSYQFFLCV